MSKPTFTMLIGLPGSGKSTYAQKTYIDANIHSSNALREELYPGEYNTRNNSKVFSELHRRIKEDLRSGKDVVYDATNLQSKRRKGFLVELSKIDCCKVANIIATPYEVCLLQNELRERHTPENAIERYYKIIEVPFYDEGWDNIHITYIDDKYKNSYGSYNQFVFDTMDFSQHNPHHKLTLGDHCLNCYQFIDEHTSETSIAKLEELKIAALIHDCGKPFVQTFENHKGEITSEAHYYNHEYVGSYNSLFYEMDNSIDKLYVAALIRFHMVPHFMKDWNASTVTKYKERFTSTPYLFETDFWNNLKRLHTADLYAH